MNKLIPIITVAIAVLTLCIAAVGIIAICISAKVEQVGLVAVPVVIIGGVASALSAPFAFIFRRDKLCRYAFFLQIAAFIISVVSIIVWLTAL